jgi:hypothetical protein
MKKVLSIATAVLFAATLFIAPTVTMAAKYGEQTAQAEKTQKKSPKKAKKSTTKKSKSAKTKKPQEAKQE